MTVRKPLEGVHILDTTDEWGELCGRLLAELGAEVIRVEPPGGSASRRLAPRFEEVGLFHAFRNVGKRMVALDLGTPGDRQAMQDLLGWADAWLDSSRSGARSQWQLEPAETLARHPHLVITSITPFGRTGPYSTWEATSSVVEALSGMMFKAGVAEKPPLMPPSSISNDVASVTAGFATLVALWQKETTGHGQLIDLSVMEAAAQTTDWSMPNASVMRAANLPYAQVRSGSGIYGVHPCKDGFLRLVIVSPRHWRAMRAWLGEPEYLQDPTYDLLYSRMGIGALLDELYREHFSSMTRDEAVVEAQRRGLAATPVLKVDDVLVNEHLQSRQVFLDYQVGPDLVTPLLAGFFEVDGVRHRPGFGIGPLQALGNAALAHRDDPQTPAPEPSLPLIGLRVLDFGIGGVGVEGGRLFAEYGADVIKIENRKFPDFMRHILGTAINPSFASSSRSKRAFGVNPKHPDGLKVIYDLIATSDVIIENSSTGTMASLKVDFESVHAANPRVVMASSQLLGSSGPWAGWIGYGPSTLPISGLFSLWDYADNKTEAPAGSTSIMPDHLAGRVLALGAMAGLLARRETGEGCHLEVAQVEVAATMIGDQLLAEGLTPGSVVPQGNRRADGAPWGAYPCEGNQEWCVITIRHDDDWERLKSALGQPEWATAPSLATVGGRRMAHDDIDIHLSHWTSRHTKEQVAQTLQSFGVPSAPMLTGADQLDDPHLVAHGYPTPLDQQGVGPMLLEGRCFLASGMSEPVVTQAPMPGEHTREIGRQLLGLSETEIQDLIDSGALEVTESTP